jgi:hypothetical protein
MNCVKPSTSKVLEAESILELRQIKQTMEFHWK